MLAPAGAGPMPHSIRKKAGESHLSGFFRKFGSEMGKTCRIGSSNRSRLSRLLGRQFCFLFGSIGFDSCDRALQPVLYVLPQLFFRLIRRCDCNPLAIQQDVVAGHVFGAVFLRNEVIEQALVTSVWTRWVPVVRASQRVLEDGSRPPRRAIPISITPLLQEVEFVPQNLQNIASVVRHDFLQRSEEHTSE